MTEKEGSAFSAAATALLKGELSDRDYARVLFEIETARVLNPRPDGPWFVWQPERFDAYGNELGSVEAGIPYRKGPISNDPK